MKITVKEFTIFIGVYSRSKIFIRNVLNRPLWPNNARKPIATTIVGITKGRVVAALSRVFPGNSYLANKNAAGRPIIKVNRVDTSACHVVNQILPR